MNKKAEIKNRIDLINRGEVPEGYKKVHGQIIPKKWNSYIFKDIFKERIEKTNNIDNYPLYSLTIDNGVVPKTEQYERSFLITKDGDSYKIVKENDFVMNPMNLRFGAIARYKGGKDCSVSGYYNIFSIINKFDNYYMETFLKSQRMINYYNSMATGSLIEKQRVHYSQFEEFNFCFPDIVEQEKITEILKKCDKVIELKEKLICEEIKKNINCGRKVLKKLKGDTVEIGEILDYEQPTKYIVKNQYKNKQNEEDIPVLTANKAFIKSYTNEKFGIYDNLPVIIFDDFTVENKYVTFPFKVQSSAMKILKPKNPNINLLFVYKSMQLLKFKANDHKRYYLSEYQYMPINLPDIETQNRTVEILSKIDRKIELLQQELEQYKQLKKSLSQLLLTGIVRTVEVDCEN